LRTENVAAPQAYATAARIRAELRISRVATFPGLRALAWYGNVLYASRGYDLLSATMDGSPISWQTVASYSPTWWRNLTVRSHLRINRQRRHLGNCLHFSTGRNPSRSQYCLR